MSAVYPDPLCKRPAVGKAGRACQVNVNYFPITFKNPGTAHQYDITITPVVPPHVQRQIFEQFLLQYAKDRKVLNGIAVVFDGVKNAFSPRCLPLGEAFKADIPLPERGGRAQEARVFVLTVTKVKEILIDPAEMNSRTPAGLTAIMVYNIVFRHQPNKTFLQVGDSFFTREASRKIALGVEVWHGFFRSFLPVADGLALNVDTIVCTFYQPGSLLDLLVAFLRQKTRDDLRDPRFRDHIKSMQSFVKNLRVRLTHRAESTSDYRVLRLTDRAANVTEFDLVEDGVDKGKVTVDSYFAKTMGVRLNFPTLPCVEIKKGVLVPLELCEVVAGQRYAKRLNDAQTAEMIKITCVPPKERAAKIMAGLRLMDCENNACLKQFGISVAPALKLVNARILPPPTVLYNPSCKDKSLRPVDGAWNLRDKRLFEGMSLKTWSVIVFMPEARLARAAVGLFLKELVTTCNETGMAVAATSPRITYAGTAVDTVRACLTTAYSDAKARPQMLLCILPDRGAELYGNIKRVCEMELGMLSQCVQLEKVFRPNKQYCANVCLKMNAKLGGINASMAPAELGDLRSPPTLLMGADVTHPSPGAIDGASIAAVIGSLDFTAARYACEVRVQEARVEMITDMKQMTVALLKTLYRVTRRKPERIIYFRDGVSEGQFQEVLVSELKAIKQACASLQSNYNPKVTFVVVQKRHHTRFFPIKPLDMDRSGNCKAGTVVDTGICHPHYFDFFLQSHGGLQGTSRPVHYHVLIDEIRFSVDKLQALCNNLCYLFSRATRAVSLVPPVYYAHLAAARARFHYKISDSSETSEESGPAPTKMVHGDLSQVMYYV